MTWFNDDPEYDEYTEREEIAADIVFENCRTEVFSAIRRAVALAREYDRDAAHKDFSDEFCRQRFQDALDVRGAIRAAIGSDKS